MGKDRIIDMPNGLLGLANNITPLIKELKMKKLQDLADEKGFFILESDLSKDTKDYDYIYMCLLRKWLRDEHGIHIKVYAYAHIFLAEILTDTYRSWKKIDGMFSEYQEALQEALTLALNEIE